MTLREKVYPEILASVPQLDGKCSAIVAIPARNEVARISRCLAALAVQRDRLGAPIVPGSFGVLLLVNNSDDATANAARDLTSRLPYPLEIIEVSLSSATAGGARRRAMDEAARRLKISMEGGVLLTTDADSMVTPCWISDNINELALGADCVAGYIDADPSEIVSLGATFLKRGRLEDTYLRLVAEIYALCDPRLHNPWPNHRVSSGASLAVKLTAFEAVGGMPDTALGEDAAFTAILDENGFKVRHALDVSVLTSCRLDGRAVGGAAQTMRHRRDVPDAPCDEELETASSTLLRATLRGMLRKACEKPYCEETMQRLFYGARRQGEPVGTFTEIWKQIEAQHPKLVRNRCLRPSDLPREIAAAKFFIRHLRLISQRTGAQGDRYPRANSPALADA